MSEPPLDPKPINPEQFALDICMPNEYRMRLVTMIQDIDAAFVKHGIRGCAISGTLLGAIRHKSVIPWDDDGDFMALEDDRELVMKKVVPDLCDKGYQFKDMSTTWFKVFMPMTAMAGQLRILGNVTCDIFFYAAEDDENGQRLVPCDEEIRVKFPKCWFYEDEVFPSKPTVFEGGHIQIPRRPLRYLNTMYPRWAVDCVVAGHGVEHKDELYCIVPLKIVLKCIREHPE